MGGLTDPRLSLVDDKKFRPAHDGSGWGIHEPVTPTHLVSYIRAIGCNRDRAFDG